MSTEILDVAALRQSISEGEWQAHVKLAQAYHLATQSGGADLIILPDAVAEKAAQAFDSSIRNHKYQLHWDAYIRQLNRNAL